MHRTTLVDPNLFELKGRQESLQKHYEKLKEIKTSEPKRFYSKTVPSLKCKSSVPSDRKQEISRANKLLLDKITSIAQRKPGLPDILSKPVKSLNHVSRKERVKKINEENEQIAERLRSQKALIKKKHLDKEFQKSRRYKDQVSKKKLIQMQSGVKLAPAAYTQRSHTPLVCEGKEEERNLAQRRTSVTPLKPPVAFVNRNEFECNLESDSSYSDSFEADWEALEAMQKG